MASFYNRVYEVVKNIPKGKVMSYKAVASKLGTKAYQAIGLALSRNKDYSNVPCHRVVKSDGSLGGYNLGRDAKMKKLTDEGIIVTKDGKIDLTLFYYVL
jgi:methylated-DNA-[protein]-cysteine S-methyltransferase